MNIQTIAAIIGLLILFILLWQFVHKVRNRFIGYGWLVTYKDGNVVVLTRLLESPAGRAKVNSGAVILEVNGEKIFYDSKETYLADFKQGKGRLSAKKVDEEVIVKIREGESERTITMKAEVIWGPVPYHEPLPDLPHHLWKTWPMQDPRTGQLYVKARYSPAFH